MTDYRVTLNWCQKALKHQGPRLQQAMRKTQYIADIRKYPRQPECKQLARACAVECWSSDTINAAYDLQQQGYSPLVLNMASEFKPGGGWRKGSRAQEESLFYRSTYCLSLESGNYNRTWNYPLGKYASVYSPDVLVMLDENQQPYPVSEMAWMDFLALPGIRKPVLVDSHLSDSDQALLRTKIEFLFEFALSTQHDSVVLGALGCGAFANPPQDVAALFHQVIMQHQYQHKFQRLVFAILGQPNFSVFSRQFSNPASAS